MESQNVLMFPLKANGKIKRAKVSMIIQKVLGFQRKVKTCWGLYGKQKRDNVSTKAKTMLNGN